MSRDQQHRVETAPLSTVRNRNRSAVGFRHFLYDEPPESSTTGTFRLCPIGPVKPFEEMGKMVRLDPIARIVRGDQVPGIWSPIQKNFEMPINTTPASIPWFGSAVPALEMC